LHENNKEKTIEKFFANSKSRQTPPVDDEIEFNEEATTSKASNDDPTVNDDSFGNDEESNLSTNSSIEIINITNKNIEEITGNSKKPATKIDFFKTTNQYTDEFGQNFDEEKDYIECEKCKKKILVWDMPEHSDYHFAVELSKVDKYVNNSNTANNSNIETGIVISKSTSSKRLNNETTASATNKKLKKNDESKTGNKKIESYFKKKV
jgi:hypothetical protein